MTPPDSRRNDIDGDAAGTPATKKKSDRVKVKGWPGYVRGGLFIIEKRIGTEKFHVSTRATSLRAALKQLERFEADPNAYSAKGSKVADTLALDGDMVDAFHEFHLPSVSRHWARVVRSRLYDWADHLKGADLRKLSLVDHLKPHLKEATQAHHRAKAIKLLFGWLRQEKGSITRAQDVTLDLVIPTLKAAQATGESKAVPWESVAAVAPLLAIHVRDVLELLAATGWHVEEVRRFSGTGLLREPTAADAPNALLLITTVQKNGRKHTTALVHPHHVEVAKRVRAMGKVIDNNRLRKHMLRAAEQITKARLEKDPEAKPFRSFQLGAIRHSVATWLRQAGVPDGEIAAFLGHESAVTTRKHYIDHQVPALVLPRTALRIVG